MATKERWQRATITIDRDRGSLVLGRMLQVYREQKYPFSYALHALPWKRENLPREIAWHSQHHAMFLFILCLWMRGGIASDVAAVKLAEVFRIDNRWFDPYWARTQTHESLLAVLKQAGLAGLARKNAEFWIENCGRLCERFDGDPVSILRDVADYDAACERIRNRKRKGVRTGFMGFQEKMVSMIIYFLIDAGFPGLEQFNYPIPVDIHVMRILLANEILHVTGLPRRTNLYDNRVLSQIRLYFLEYCSAEGLDATMFSEILWIWSRELCTREPGNTVSHVGGKNRSARFATIPIDWNDPAVIREYRKGCASCACEETCHWSVPSAIYYVRGEVYRWARRKRPPAGSALRAALFDMTLGDSEFVPAKRPQAQPPRPPSPEVIQGILYDDTE